MPGLERLKKRSDFLRLRRKGRKAVAKGVVLQYAPPPDTVAPSALRTGFTVTRKVGNAVIRNRIRRRLKAAAAEILPHEASPGDYVLIGRRRTLTRPYEKLLADVRACLRETNAETGL